MNDKVHSMLQEKPVLITKNELKLELKIIFLN